MNTPYNLLLILFFLVSITALAIQHYTHTMHSTPHSLFSITFSHPITVLQHFSTHCQVWQPYHDKWGFKLHSDIIKNSNVQQKYHYYYHQHYYHYYWVCIGFCCNFVCHGNWCVCIIERSHLQAAWHLKKIITPLRHINHPILLMRYRVTN